MSYNSALQNPASQYPSEGLLGDELDWVEVSSARTLVHDAENAAETRLRSLDRVAVRQALQSRAEPWSRALEFKSQAGQVRKLHDAVVFRLNAFSNYLDRCCLPCIPRSSECGRAWAA